MPKLPGDEGVNKEIHKSGKVIIRINYYLMWHVKKTKGYNISYKK